jgi:hypothetical protein
VSVDPIRVVTIPYTVNGKTGLVCRFIGSPRDLKLLTIPELLEGSKTYPSQCYPEPLESCSFFGEDCNEAMKSRAKNRVRAEM